MICIHLCAPNDTNGNPRRAYLFIADNNIPKLLIEEGYKGHHAAPEALRPLAANALRINITATEYKDWLRSAVPTCH